MRCAASSRMYLRACDEDGRRDVTNRFVFVHAPLSFETTSCCPGRCVPRWAIPAQRDRTRRRAMQIPRVANDVRRRASQHARPHGQHGGTLHADAASSKTCTHRGGKRSDEPSIDSHILPQTSLLLQYSRRHKCSRPACLACCAKMYPEGPNVTLPTCDGAVLPIRI